MMQTLAVGTDEIQRMGKLLVVGTQRTGSQALYGALNLHPDIVCGGEWVQHVPWYDKLRQSERALAGDFVHLLADRPRVRDKLLQKMSPSIRWFGFKILFRSSARWIGHPCLAPALWLDRLEGHLQWLRSRPDIHVIQLVRHDTIEWLKSKFLSRATGYYVDKPYPEEFRVRIPIRPALRAARAKAWVDSRLATLIDTNPYHRIYYEDFLADNRRSLESCLTFLRCDPGKLLRAGDFRKRQSRGRAADYIRNYAQLVAALERLPALSTPKS